MDTTLLCRIKLCRPKVEELMQVLSLLPPEVKILEKATLLGFNNRSWVVAKAEVPATETWKETLEQQLLGAAKQVRVVPVIKLTLVKQVTDELSVA